MISTQDLKLLSAKKTINREIHGKLSLIELATGVRPKWTQTIRIGRFQKKWWIRAVLRADEAYREPVLIQKTPVGLWVARTHTQLMPYKAWLSSLKASKV